ncbi:MAG: nuclear transport factor 2 family protein [Marmoricola sp.]|nr:nuclear transport factor 2 family protein [Marmoricola sp.]
MTDPAELTAEELERAFTAYQETVADIASSGGWSRFADLFTEDATYVEHAFGTFTGREAVREWVVATMTSFPGNTMTSFPMAWHVLDLPTRRVICEVRNLMPDPGDGSVHEASNLTILTYGSDGLWACEEDVYNPMRFARMAADWARVAADHGRLSAEGQQFLARLG